MSTRPPATPGAWRHHLLASFRSGHSLHRWASVLLFVPAVWAVHWAMPEFRSFLGVAYPWAMAVMGLVFAYVVLESAKQVNPKAYQEQRAALDTAARARLERSALRAAVGDAAAAAAPPRRRL